MYMSLDVLLSKSHQFRIRKEMRQLWVTLALIISCGLSGAHLNKPLHYVALQGDLSLDAEQAEEVRILNKANGDVVAEWRNNTDDGDGGNITFPCGAINRAGSYIVQLKDNPDRWIDQQELRVFWPPMLVQAPSELVNYRTSFQVKIQWIHLKCYPPPEANITISAQVAHCGLRTNTSSSGDNCTAPLVRATQPVPNIWQTGGLGSDILFDCQSLDLTGYYRVLVYGDQDSLIGSSDVIHVKLNEDFQLQVRPKFALPCARELPVFYRRPPCVTGSQDRVRLYGKTYSSNFSSSAFTLSYIGEKILDPNKSVVAIPCTMLDGWTFDALCFHFVTLAPADGAVVDISQTCIPNQNTSMAQEPEWGTWSAFSPCTAQNCGYQGVRFRYRYCEQQGPTGSFCEGHPIESENCQAPLCRQEGETNSSIGLDDIRPAKENLTSECMCGCSMELGEGTFSLVVSSALCNSSYIAWTFTAPSYSHFHLGLDYLRLDCRVDDRLTIRDGTSIYSPLIALIDGEPPVLSSETGILSTSSSQLLIEFNTNRTTVTTSLSKCVAGFVTSITSVPKEEIVAVERRTKLIEIVPPPVMTLSSLLFMLVCAVSILGMMYSKCGFQLRHRRRRNKNGGNQSQDSLWSSASEYQLVSTATSLSTIESLNTGDEMSEKRAWAVPSRLCNLIRLQKSLPNSPFLSTARSREASRLNRLSRSSTMSPLGFRRQKQLDMSYRNHSNSKGRNSPEDIEMSLINRTESETTLKDEKVLNTVSSRVVMASQSLTEDDISSHHTRSAVTRSCSAIFDPDQDLELDYYDLDVRNAGCDAPDSFLRCLADDSTYWDESQIQKALRDPEDCESIDDSNEMSLSFDEDDVSCA